MSESIGIQPIQIRFSTNYNTPLSILTKDMLYNPPKEDIINDEDKEPPNEDVNEPTKENASYPYFTDTVRFPKGKLLKLSREEQLKILFDKQLFRQTIGNISNVDAEVRSENAEYNFHTLLNILLPTTFPIKSNISETFIENIQNTGAPLNIDDSIGIYDLFAQIFSDEINKYGYISIGGKIYTVTKIMYINEIINDPIFRPLIQGGNIFQQSTKETENKINEKLKSIKGNIQSITNEKLDNIQQQIANKGNTAHNAYIDIQKDSAPGNRMSKVKDKFLVPHLNNLLQLNKNDVDQIIIIFREIYRLKEKAGERSQTYIPLPIESLSGFSTLLEKSIEYYVLTTVLNALQNVDVMNEYLEKKKNYSSSELTPTDRRIISQLNEYNKITAFANEVKKFTAPNRYYSNAELANILNQMKINMNEFIQFINFINELRVEGTKPKADLFNNSTMINRLKTGIMSCIEGNEKYKDDTLGLKSKKYYDTFVNLQLVGDIIDDTNVEEIKCPYRDRMLMNQYKNIKYADQKNPVLFYTELPFDMAKTRREYKEKKEKKVGGRKTSKKRYKGGYKGRPSSLRQASMKRSLKRKKYATI